MRHQRSQRSRMGFKESAGLVVVVTLVVLGYQHISRSYDSASASTKSKAAAPWAEPEMVWIPADQEFATRLESAEGVKVESLVWDAAKHVADTAPHSVALKKVLPPSGDPHDYLSLDPEYFPAANASDPWTRRLGQTNPGSRAIPDQEYFLKTVHAVTALSLAYQHGPDHGGQHHLYRARAVKRLREWFCTQETRMNPRNLFAGAVTNRISKDLAGTEFAKALGGGTREGMLDLWPLSSLLSSTSALDIDITTRSCLDDWVNQYMDFHASSSLADAARDSGDAHAIYYDVQIVSMWRYLGQKDVARSYLKLNSMHRLDAHIRRDGRLFRELTKKSSWSSSLFALRGWIILASQAEAVGIDLWHIQPPGWNQPILQKACSYMLSHAALGDSKPSKTWPVTDADLTFKIAPEYLSLFIYAEKAYRVQEKDDPVSRKWQVWMEYVHSIAATNSAEKERERKGEARAAEGKMGATVRLNNPTAEKQKPMLAIKW